MSENNVAINKKIRYIRKGRMKKRKKTSETHNKERKNKSRKYNNNKVRI